MKTNYMFEALEALEEGRIKLFRYVQRLLVDLREMRMYSLEKHYCCYSQVEASLWSMHVCSGAW